MVSAISESQQSEKLIRIVEVRATRKDRAQHYEGKKLEFLKEQREQRRD